MLRPDGHRDRGPGADLRGFLLHRDPVVRDSVAFYFHESWSENDDLLPLVLQACREYGEERSLVILSLASRFRLSTAALLDAVQELERSQPPFVEDWLACAPLGLIASHEDLVRSVLSFAATMRIDRRRAFHKMSTNKLWQRINAAAHRLDVLTDPMEESFARSELADLKEALAWRESGAALADKMTELTAITSATLRRCLVELAGAMKLHELTSKLVDVLAYEDDDGDLAECAAGALGRLGTPVCVRLIAERYHERGWSFRLSAVAALQTLKTRVSEQLLHRLLEFEDDPALRGRIFDALRFHFTEASARAIREEIRRPSSWMIEDELKKALFVNAQILGRDDPEAERWRHDLYVTDHDSIVFYIPVMDVREPGAHGLTEDHDVFDDVEGRPCPCGSGKAFEECCARP